MTGEGKDARRILRERAAALARMEEPVPRGAVELLTFGAGGETFAIETSFVREVMRGNRITPLPGVPPFVAGIMNVRGEIVSVLDLLHLLALPGAQGRQDLVIVLHDDAMTFGLAADRLIGTCRLAPEQIDTPFPQVPANRGLHIKGSTPDRIVILDGEALLHDERLVIREAEQRKE